MKDIINLIIENPFVLMTFYIFTIVGILIIKAIINKLIDKDYIKLKYWGGIIMEMERLNIMNNDILKDELNEMIRSNTSERDNYRELSKGNINNEHYKRMVTWCESQICAYEDVLDTIRKLEEDDETKKELNLRF